MTEDETIVEFNERLSDIANEAFTLGEKISKEKLIIKTPQLLTKRFAIKVTIIEEAKDVTSMKLEELIGSSRTFEMTLDNDDRPPRKEKNWAL